MYSHRWSVFLIDRFCRYILNAIECELVPMDSEDLMSQRILQYIQNSSDCRVRAIYSVKSKEATRLFNENALQKKDHRLELSSVTAQKLPKPILRNFFFLKLSYVMDEMWKKTCASHNLIALNIPTFPSKVSLKCYHRDVFYCFGQVTHVRPPHSVQLWSSECTYVPMSLRIIEQRVPAKLFAEFGINLKSNL